MSRVDLALAGALDFEHTPDAACGCDLCDAARVELSLWHDARRAIFLDEVDGGPLPFELAWVPPANDLCDEVA